MNDKFDIVTRHHLMYGTTGTERYHDWVVCSIEKNFARSRFLPRGRIVSEVLADLRLGQE